MKAAVCLHGLARGSSVQADGAFLENYSTLLKKIGGADIFIHSWDEDIKEHLIQTFSPVSNLFESQRKFPKELSFFSGVQFDGDTGINQGDLFKTLSFLYSRKESVRLKKEYEKKNTFKYDVVLVSRFDVGYSNSENIDYLALLYDKLPEHLNKRSEYTKLCKKGWPLSDKEDEFSGELFKEQKSTNLCQYVYEDNVLINNHSLYKFHLMENNLWEDDQAVFLNKNLWHD